MGALHGSENSGGPNKHAGETGPNSSGCLNRLFDDQRKAEWIAVIRETGRRAVANVKVGVHRGTVEKHLREDEKFAVAFEEAMQFFRESLVAEAVRRGVRGVEEPIFNRGVRAMDIHPEDALILEELRKQDQAPRTVPATVRRYSDSLLHALLKAHLPEFADKQIVQNVGPEDPTVADLDDLTPDELAQLQTFLQGVKARKDKERDGAAEADLS